MEQESEAGAERAQRGGVHTSTCALRHARCTVDTVMRPNADAWIHMQITVCRVGGSPGRYKAAGPRPTGDSGEIAESGGDIAVHHRLLI